VPVMRTYAVPGLLLVIAPGHDHQLSQSGPLEISRHGRDTSIPRKHPKRSSFQKFKYHRQASMSVEESETILRWRFSWTSPEHQRWVGTKWVKANFGFGSSTEHGTSLSGRPRPHYAHSRLPNGFG